MNLFQVTKKQPSGGLELKTFTGNPAIFTPSYSEELPAPFNTINCKCSVNAIQEGTPWIDSNVIEKEPYNFRKVAGTASRIGNHLFDKLVGGTVAFNQLVSRVDANQSTLVTNPDGSITATANGNQPFFGFAFRNENWNINGIIGHKYLCLIDIVEITADNFSVVGLGNWNGTPDANYTSIPNRYAKILPANYERPTYFNVTTIGNTKPTDTFTIKTPMVIDLTAMFGSTIADYIYSLEQTTAGAGVAWFRRLFPDSYYAYNAGELMSVKTTAHKMVGKNLYNADFPTTTKGSITLTNNNDGSYTINGSNPNDTYFDIFVGSSISKLPKDTYRLTGCPSGGSGSTYFMYTVPNFHTDGSSGSTFTDSVTGGSICIKGGVVCNNLIFKPMLRLSNSGDDTFEPYTEHNYELDDVELRGLFKLDSNNKLYADGDTYESSGDVTRKYGIVDLGSLDWATAGTDNKVMSTNSVNDIKGADWTSGNPNLINVKYTVDTGSNVYRLVKDKTIGIDGNGRIYIYDSAYTDAAAFKTAMSGVYLVYELETPTTETADPFTNPQQVDANGTEEYVDNRPVAIPVGHETYYADIYDITGFTSCKVSVKDGSNVEQKSATILFGQTVYGGILEYKNGAWTFTGTKTAIDLGSLDYTYDSNLQRFVSDTALPNIGGEIKETNFYKNVICEIYENSTSTANNTFFVLVGNGCIYIYDDRYTSASDFKAAMSGIKAVYELATPFTLTLTGEQLETLLGENRVSHNCNGDIEVTCIV